MWQEMGSLGKNRCLSALFVVISLMRLLCHLYLGASCLSWRHSCCQGRCAEEWSEDADLTLLLSLWTEGRLQGAPGSWPEAAASTFHTPGWLNPEAEVKQLCLQVVFSRSISNYTLNCEKLKTNKQAKKAKRKNAKGWRLERIQRISGQSGRGGGVGRREQKSEIKKVASLQHWPAVLWRVGVAGRWSDAKFSQSWKCWLPVRRVDLKELIWCRIKNIWGLLKRRRRIRVERCHLGW